jgi:cytochrome c biogenesis protein CcmG/thiol:disulfide interchange protein DsbE
VRVSRVRWLAVALCAAALTGCASNPAAPEEYGSLPAAATPRIPALAPCPAAGSASSLPQVTLNCLRSGRKVDMATLGGRPVLVNLWASWCAPCKREMPSLQGAYARYGHQISFLGVDTKDDINSAKDFLAAFALHYPQVADANGDLLHKVGGAGLPVTLVLNTDGKTVYSHRGELRSKDLQQALRAAGIRTAQS